VAAVLVVSASCLLSLVSIHATRYSICTTSATELRFKPQASREGQRAERACQSAGFIALCRWRHLHCRLRGHENFWERIMCRDAQVP
jgi:hypothetical protein